MWARACRVGHVALLGCFAGWGVGHVSSLHVGMVVKHGWELQTEGVSGEADMAGSAPTLYVVRGRDTWYM